MAAQTETQTTPEVTNVAEVNKETETIQFDLWGESIELPVEKAKALIEKRQTKTAEFKELQEKIQTFQNEKNSLREQLKLEQLAKENKLAQLEAHFTEKLNEKISVYRSKIIESELTKNLMNHPEFLGNDVLEDAILLLKSSNNFDLADDNSIKAGDKTITEIVSDFVSSKPAFKKASKATLSSARPAAVKAEKATNPMASLAAGVGKLLK